MLVSALVLSGDGCRPADGGSSRDDEPIPEEMAMPDPQMLPVLSTAVTAVTMVMIGRSKHLLVQRRSGRCAACGRLLSPGRRCAHCQ